jgi:hypothetical protein
VGKHRHLPWDWKIWKSGGKIHGESPEIHGLRMMDSRLFLVDGWMMNSWIITTTMGWDRNRRGSTAKSCELIIWMTYEIYQGPLTISNVHCHTRG